MMIDTSRPSPNWNDRPAGTRVSLIVIHGSDGSDNGDLDWLTKTGSEVSAHYLIQRTGHVYRLVDEEHRAWHAGKSSWQGRPNCNDYSIGIELSCHDDEAYTDAHYRALGGLLAALASRHGLTLANIVGHSQIAPGRKTDPWAQFNFGRAFDEMLVYWDGPREDAVA